MSGFKVAIGAVALVAVSFWLGRRSAVPDIPPAVEPGPIAASWDGGVLLQSEVDGYLALLRPSARAGDAVARKELVSSLARQSFLASIAHAQGLDRAPAVRRQCDQVVVDALRNGRLNKDIVIPEAEVRAAYDADLPRYSQQGGVKLAQILITADGDGPKRASALLRELTEKSKNDFYAFADAAHLHSLDGASKLAGGELPSMSEAQIGETFGADFPARLEPLEAGALFPQVITSPRGLHLIRLVERIPASITPFERVRESIAARLRAEKSANAWTDFVQRLESDTGFQVVAQ